MTAASMASVRAASEFGEIAVRVLGARPDYSVQNRLSCPSGYTNYSPQEMTVVTEWKRRLAETYLRYGFAAIELRPVEHAENLLEKGGMSKQIYGVSRLQDGGLTKLGLPFDRTVPLALFVAQNVQKLAFPYLRYDIGIAFRGEHAGPGRYRAFTQSDVDIIGPDLNNKSDAYAIATGIKALQAIGVADCNVFVNHIGIARGFMEYAGIPLDKYEAALRVLDKLKPDNREAVIAELLESVSELTEEKANELLQLMSYDGNLEDFAFAIPVSEEAEVGLRSLRETERMMQKMGIAPGIVRFRPYLVRGLDYYTGIVCETLIPGKERYGSIASGGRYDRLIDGFSVGETKLQGVGFSIGVTRLFDIMKAEEKVDLTRQTSAQVFIGYRTEAQFETALQLAESLREQRINTELYTGSKVQMKIELALCNKKGIPFAAMVMNEDEIILKDMKTLSPGEAHAAGKNAQQTFSTIEEAVNGVVTSLSSKASLKDPKDPVEEKVD